MLCFRVGVGNFSSRLVRFTRKILSRAGFINKKYFRVMYLKKITINVI